MNDQRPTMPMFTHFAIVNSDVQLAYIERFGKSGYAKAGRVVSGLLKAAAKSGEIKVHRKYGPVTGDSVFYELTEEQLTRIRAVAIKRAKTID